MNIVAVVLSWLGGSTVAKIKACIPDLVKEAEKASADGKITPAERKQFVMMAIDIITTKMGGKLTGIARWAVSKLVDEIAKKLPPQDIKVHDVIVKLLKEWANA